MPLGCWPVRLFPHHFICSHPPLQLAVSVPTVWAPFRFSSSAKADRVSPARRRRTGTPHSHVKPGKSPLTLGLIGHGVRCQASASRQAAPSCTHHTSRIQRLAITSRLSHGPSPVALHPLLFPGGEDASPETLPACRQCGGGLPCLQLHGTQELRLLGLPLPPPLKQQRASKGGPRPSTPLLPTLLCFRSHAQRLKVFVPLLRAQEVHGASKRPRLGAQ